MERKEPPVSIAVNLAASQVKLVHVTRGWTSLVKDLGSLAPKTKVDRVVKSIKSAWSGTVTTDDDEVRDASTDVMPPSTAPKERNWNVESENAFFGNGAAAAATPFGSIDAVLGGLFLPPPDVNFRTPITE